MKKFITTFCCAVIVLPLTIFAQTLSEKIDTSVISQIKNEEMAHSQVMDIESYLTDVYGPRLTGSPEFEQAAKWAEQKLKDIGLENVSIETWGPFGRGWSLKNFSAEMVSPRVSPLIAYPKAWSPGTEGTVESEAIYLKADNDSELAQYKGKLKGKIVLLSDPEELHPHFKPDAERRSDEELLKMANAGEPQPRGRFMFGDSVRMQQFRQRMNLARMKMEFCQKEKAAVLVEASRGDDGTIFVQSATVPQPADTPFDKRIQPYDVHAPKILPQIVFSSEQYNRIIRILEKGIPVKLRVTLDVKFTDEQPGMNIIGEIPGTDLKDQIVMIGAHFDSWHAGTGATDNASGSSVCIEAMRILKALHLTPRRTIRIGLWSGEEEGLLGSRAYVAQHFAQREGGWMNPRGAVTPKPGYEKFDVYFNDDNGTGKFRGVYMQGNAAVWQIFKSWLAPFADMGASTLTLQNTGGTDHLSFDAVGLPGFQFIQDEMDYEVRTHHSNMDVFDRVQSDDLKQAAIIMASFAYNAAMRDEMFPRKPVEISAQRKSSQ